MFVNARGFGWNATGVAPGDVLWCDGILAIKRYSAGNSTRFNSEVLTSTMCIVVATDSSADNYGSYVNLTIMSHSDIYTLTRYVGNGNALHIDGANLSVV